MKIRKIILILSALLFGMAQTHAEDVLTVGNVTLPQNGEVALEINGTFDTNFTQFQLNIVLEKGIWLTLNKNSRPWAEMGDESTDHTISSSVSGQTFQFVCSSMNQETLPSGGVLMRVKIVPDGELPIGTVLHGTVTSIVFSEHTAGGSNVGHNFDAMPFTVTIGTPVDPRTVLDENATDAPTAVEDVDVRVKRTINAGEWSTICLPFSMTETQVKAAFGNDVELGDFKGYEATIDDDDNVVGLSVKFQDATAIEANHPYIIKVSSSIAEFTVDGVDIDPEDEPTVAAVKRTKKQWSEMIGTYVANTTLESTCLFLSGNQFWYSAGSTKMKAYRAYFDFYDVLTVVEDAYSSRIAYVFDSDATGIRDSDHKTMTNNHSFYDLQGRKVEESSVLKKGLYILNGKIVVK